MHKSKKDTTMKKNFLDSMKEMFNFNSTNNSGEDIFPVNENETSFDIKIDDIFDETYLSSTNFSMNDFRKF